MKLFYKHKNDERSKSSYERFFVQNILVMIICTLLCIAALSGTTWAWFNNTIVSSTQHLEIANCNIDISVSAAASEEYSSETTDLSESENYSTYQDGFKYIFEANKTYRVTLSATGSASTCYSKIEINGVGHYTEQFNVGGTMSFTLTFGSETVVCILPRWGTGSMTERSFANGGDYKIGITEPETDSPNIPSESEEPSKDEPDEMNADSEPIAPAPEAEPIDSETEAQTSPATETEPEAESNV